MAGLGTSLVSVGLSTITADLHAAQGGEWVTSAYPLVLAAVLPACSWMPRRWGASRVCVVSLVVFVAASVLCALTPNLIVLILARVLQGVAGGIMVPTGQTIVLQRVDRSRMGRTMSIAGLPLMLAPAIGPCAASPDRPTHSA